MTLTQMGSRKRTTGFRSRRRWELFGLLFPGLLGIFVGFVLPVFVMFRMSLNTHGTGGQLVESVSLGAYRAALTDPFYWEVIGNTLVLGLGCGAAATILSYPLALFLVRTTSKWKGVLIALAIAPLLTSAVARTYGWIAILGDQGVVNDSLMRIGVLDAPIQLSNNLLGTTIALVEILMPYAILAMISGFGRISPSLEEAAGSLGASKLKTFVRITLPLSLPGVFTGFLLVFVLAISSFVTPRLLGGGRVFILATEVYNEATQTLNWPLASALSVILLVVFGLMIAVYQRLIAKFEG
ncbi:putative spermidine/putrescine transport system permease protein [Brevibacterium sanguinis]|uniref:Spermidine/putrescine transport system permease protein n=2 Tax=Brevibacterium TaxID=1696 RepID=A0ABX9GU77_9MICO|nr:MULTISPECIES: ABC transporter permease [Brevibacterium]RBP66083.1 putative spermidine/putrescine transport system permease protein [Brevibacterium sanguinis]RBP72734.1 putative spermidine/putrescine transport system permease protein [Brevibacterium celere]